MFILERAPLKLFRAVQCCPDAVSRAFKLKRVLYERSETLFQCVCETVERAPLKLFRAVQCCADAVSSAFKLKRVLYERSDTLFQ
jgi:hypothetical protein